MIPLVLVTGFFGSGKTTFLRHLSKRNDGKRLAFLVNDFAAADIDAQALTDLDGEMISIPGGSVFCRCLATTFTNALTKIAGSADGVIIEASGMADPRALADLLRETRLDEIYTLSAVVALADPGTLRKLLKTLPAVKAQIQTADILLLNKTDLFDEEPIARTEAAVRDVRRDIEIVRCVRGDVDIQFFRGESHAMAFHSSPAKCRDDSFLSATHRFRAQCDIGAVVETLDGYAKILWRAKGFVPTAQGLMELQWVMRADSTDCGAVDIRPATSREARPALVVIAKGNAQEQLDALVRSLLLLK